MKTRLALAIPSRFFQNRQTDLHHSGAFVELLCLRRLRLSQSCPVPHVGRAVWRMRVEFIGGALARGA